MDRSTKQIISKETQTLNDTMDQLDLIHDNPKPMGFSKSSAQGKVQSNTSLPQETREKSNK